MSRESVSPVDAIRAILHDYPFSAASILRELLQNSDDARATKQVCTASLRKHCMLTKPQTFVLDIGKNPALMAYNDSQFQEEDWNAIKTVHTSAKRADTS